MIRVRKPTEQEIVELQGWPVWEKEESTFDWEYNTEERCFILEGTAEVRTGGDSYRIKRGDFVVFSKGLKCTWHIKEKIRKHYKFA